MSQSERGIVRLGNKTFQTLKNDMTIEILDDILLIKAKLKRSKIIYGLYCFGALLFFGFGLILYFINLSNKIYLLSDSNKPFNFSGFNFSASKVFSFIFITILIYIFWIACINYIFIRNKNKKRFNINSSIKNITELIILVIMIFSILAQFNFIQNSDFVAIPFLMVAVLHYFGLHIYNNTYTEIRITKKDGKYDIKANRISKLIYLAPNFLIQKKVLFKADVKELYLSLVHAVRNSRQTRTTLNNRRLFNYSWLSLEEAKNISQDKNEFILFLTQEKMFLDQSFGVMIGIQYPIQLIEKILAFINIFAPISVLKLENIPEKEFINFAVKNPVKMNKTVSKIVLIFSLMIFVPIYLFVIVITPFIFYLVFVVPGLYYEVTFFLLGLMCLAIILLPIVLWRQIKKAKIKQQDVIERYSYQNS